MIATLIPLLHRPGGGPALRPVGLRHGDGFAYDPGRGFYPIRQGILDLLPEGPGTLSPAQRSNLVPLTAWGYESLWRPRALTLLSGEPFSFTRERALLFDLLGTPAPGPVVDLAASTALYGRWLAAALPSQTHPIVSLDLALPMLREARRRALREGLPALGLVRARAEALPFAHAQVAGAVCGGSLNEFGPHGLAPILHEMRRVLAPGAPAVWMHLVAAKSRPGLTLQRFLARTGGLSFPSPTETRAAFQAAGFRITDEQQYGVVVFSRLEKR